MWSIVQLLHRNLSAGLIQGSHVLLTEPPLSGDISEAGDEQKISSNLLDYGPPKLSLELQARETSVDPTALPSLAANEMPLAIAETTWPVTDLEKGQETPQSTVADLEPLWEELAAPDESVGQGQPIPQLTARAIYRTRLIRTDPART